MKEAVVQRFRRDMRKAVSEDQGWPSKSAPVIEVVLKGDSGLILCGFCVDQQAVSKLGEARAVRCLGEGLLVSTTFLLAAILSSRLRRL